ncbi:MAG: HD domain-containing protein [Clostridiales bacterium]|nr:HD domain-containing protein [Clostridiales bacterium]
MVESLYKDLISNLEQKHLLNIDLVIKAYNIASSLHKEQKRKDGTPYIMHPVSVAKILEELDFNADIIASALLHDVVEDCGYTLEEIKQNLNANVAQIVDAVTAIENLDNSKEFAKLDAENKTYQKLLSIGKDNRFAFFIKFADRLNNLKTISCFPKYKQIEKVKETENWLIPILKIFKATYLFNAIRNECFLIKNSNIISKFLFRYDKYNRLNENNFNFVKSYLSDNLNHFIFKKKYNLNLKKAVMENVLPVETYENLIKSHTIEKLTYFRTHQFNATTFKKIFILFDEDDKKKEINNMFFDFISQPQVEKNINLIGYSHDPNFNHSYFILVDNCKNKYEVYLFTEKEYIEYKNGSIEGAEIEHIEDDTTKPNENFIKVFTKSGEEIYLPEGSTVLDFAFKIHNDLGFSCLHAHLNESPSKTPIYAKLTQNDKVNLVLKLDDETGHKQNIAQIRWLTYVNTENAKKNLAKYFENKYENL